MWAAPAEELSQLATPPCSRSRSLRVGRRSVRPVARRSRSRNAGGPTGTGTRPRPSSSATTLPCRPWAAGKHPVASEAEFTRGRGREDRAVVGVPARGRREAMQRRSERLGHVIAAQAVDHDEDGATPGRRAAVSGHEAASEDAGHVDSACPLERASSEVALAESRAESIVAPLDLGALAGLMVRHVHHTGAPVPIEMPAVVLDGEGLEQRVLAVVVLGPDDPPDPRRRFQTTWRVYPEFSYRG